MSLTNNDLQKIGALISASENRLSKGQQEIRKELQEVRKGLGDDIIRTENKLDSIDRAISILEKKPNVKDLQKLQAEVDELREMVMAMREVKS